MLTHRPAVYGDDAAIPQTPAGALRTLDGDVDPNLVDGLFLAHEHVHARFGTAMGDPDLDFDVEAEIEDDLRETAKAGIAGLLEVSTIDMDFDLARIMSLSSAAGLLVVKSTGWFRGAAQETAIGNRSVDELEAWLVHQIDSGIRPHVRAGAIGEVGITGDAATNSERRVLEASAGASQRTGAAIVLHTDDVRNADGVWCALTRAGASPNRLVVGHMRASDPLTWQLELASQGALLAFDQLGHPDRDGPQPVVRRITDLIARSSKARIAISTDVGRRSRLCCRGGSGRVAPTLEVLSGLCREGIDMERLRDIGGRTAVHYLAIRPRANT